MSIWGVESGTCEENILKPLGLVSYGGGTNPKNGKATYIVYSFDNDFKYEIDVDKIKNIEKIYKKYIRLKKLEQINGI